MMNRFLKRFFLLASLSLIGLSLLTSGGHLLGDEKEAAKKPAIEKKVRAKERGRLPAQYRKVVTNAQREKIYAIQLKYRPRIKDLQAQLKALRVKQDKEMEALLTDEQKSQISKLREEATQKRAKRKERSKSKNSSKKGNATNDH